MLSHIVISRGGNPEWKEKGELWIRSNLELLPGYPTGFSGHRGLPSEQTRYPVFSGSRFAGLYAHSSVGMGFPCADPMNRYYIRSVRYLAPQSPEVHDLVARKYTNEKKRAIFVRHRFAIVTLVKGNFGGAGAETSKCER